MGDPDNPGKGGYKSLDSWLTFLAPLAFGLFSGLGALLLPWLDEDGSVSPGERFLGPVVAGLVLAVVLQTGRWWLGCGEEERVTARLRALVSVTWVAFFVAAGLALLLDPPVLALLLIVPVCIGIVAFFSPKQKISLVDRRLGTYLWCVLAIGVSLVTVFIAFGFDA